MSLSTAAVDAMRVADGKQADNAFVDPQSELTYTKCCEICGESIPSSILQTYAVLHSSEVDGAVVFSIFSSASAIAFASSTISLDYDIDPVKRITSPSFCGYLPNENRMAIFLLMMMMLTFHVLLKVIAFSLMLSLSQVWLILYMVGDMSLYLIYKTAKGEMRYALRLSGVFSWITAFIFRIVVKSISDL